MRILLIGTHPSQTTGYSKVVFNIAKNFGRYPESRLTIYGIQKFTDVNDGLRLNLPSNVAVWDVYDKDKEDFGFGTNSLFNFVLINDPDVVVVYNDPEVTQKYIMNLKIIQNSPQYKSMCRGFKITSYLDQVHRSHDIDTISYISQNVDHVFCFTPSWRENYLSFFSGDDRQNYAKKTSVVKHGVELNSYTLEEVQSFKNELGFPKDSFIFLNLNRFATKKRLDISIIAFVKFLRKTSAKNAYIYFPCVVDKDISELKKIYLNELRINGLDKQFENRLAANSSRLSDTDIHKIYQFSDVGLNTCDGEGFGLCNYEHAAYGKPQILSKVGGLLDYFNDSNSLLCTPRTTSYTTVLEKGEIVSSDDVAEHMVKYFMTPSFYNKHANILKEIPQKYRWSVEIDSMMSVLLTL